MLDLILPDFICRDGWRKCDDGIQCVLDFEICNGHAACNDGSDENPKKCKGIKKKKQIEFLMRLF